jgi:hypothetical protein
VTRAHDAEIIHDFAEFGENFADLDAGFAFLLELERRRHRHAVRAGDGFAIVLGE